MAFVGSNAVYYWGRYYAGYFYDDAPDVVDLDVTRPPWGGDPSFNPAMLPDYVSTAGGDDTIVASAKKAGSYYDAGTGIDTLSLAHFTDGASVTLADAGGIGYGPLGMSIVNVENLIGSAGNDTLTGNNGDNSIFGAYGRDEINGLAGNDRLDGSAGADSIFGGDGNDVIFTGWDLDTDFVRGGAGNDQIWAGDRDQVGGGLGRDLFFFNMDQFGPLIQGESAGYGIGDFESGIDKIVVPKGFSATIADFGVEVSGRTPNGTSVRLMISASGVQEGDLLFQ